jgi:hypothetical protein
VSLKLRREVVWAHNAKVLEGLYAGRQEFSQD